MPNKLNRFLLKKIFKKKTKNDFFRSARIGSLVIVFSTLTVLVLLGAFSFLFDPLQLYRKASYHAYLQPLRYTSPGIIKHYDYESILLGSSMAQNFATPEIRRALGGCKSIKNSAPRHVPI